MSSISDTYQLEERTSSERPKDLSSLIKLDHLKGVEKDYALDLILKNEDVFHLPGQELPGTDTVTHHIPTINDVPANARRYQHPHALKEEIDRQIQELLKMGLSDPPKIIMGPLFGACPSMPTLRLNLDGDWS